MLIGNRTGRQVTQAGRPCPNADDSQRLVLYLQCLVWFQDACEPWAVVGVTLGGRVRAELQKIEVLLLGKLGVAWECPYFLMSELGLLQAY